MKQQNRFILIVLCWTLMSGHSMAQSAPEPRIRFGPVDRAICQDYVKLLNQTPPKEPLQVCGSQIDQLPGAKPIEWQELDLLHNLELLHKMEWLLRAQIKPDAPPEFKDWLKQFQRRVKQPASLPRIKQARVTIEPDQPPQLIYSYEEAGPSCSARKLAAWDKGFGPFILFNDEIKNGHDWSWKRGDAFVYDDQLHLFYSYLNDKTHFFQWTALIKTFDGKQFRQGKYSVYQSAHVCSFHDSEHSFPPPRR